MNRGLTTAAGCWLLVVGCTTSTLDNAASCIAGAPRALHPEGEAQHALLHCAASDCPPQSSWCGAHHLLRHACHVQVTGLCAGDHVVPLGSALGTWRSEGVWQAADWHKVPSDLPLAAATTLAINPPTALLMLEDVVKLQPGDVVVQNGATSGVGQVRDAYKGRAAPISTHQLQCRQQMCCRGHGHVLRNTPAYNSSMLKQHNCDGSSLCFLHRTCLLCSM